MPSCRTSIVLAVLLPGLAAAADPSMLQLIMPDARFVMDIDIAKLGASPIGKSISTQMKSELSNAGPDWQSMIDTRGPDWTQYVQEIILAGGPGSGKDVPMLAIVRSTRDPKWIKSLPAFQGNGNSTVAVVDGSVAIVGNAANVDAALRRRGQKKALPPVLEKGLRSFDGQYDAWVVSEGPLAAAAKSPATAAMQWPQRVEALNAGLRLSPDFQVSGDVTMRSEKDVDEIANASRWFTSMLQAQAKGAVNLDKVSFQAAGRRLSFLVIVPEKEVLAALRHRQAGQDSPVSPAIFRGLLDPPPGSIRVQSSPSDMGTRLLRLSK